MLNWLVRWLRWVESRGGARFSRTGNALRMATRERTNDKVSASVRLLEPRWYIPRIEIFQRRLGGENRPRDECAGLGPKTPRL
jgi:hypothetical protein